MVVPLTKKGVTKEERGMKRGVWQEIQSSTLDCPACIQVDMVRKQLVRAEIEAGEMFGNHYGMASI